MGKPPGALPDIQSFPPLDAEQIARELRLDERAEKAAMAGQPAADADGPDSAELDVLGKIEGYARKAREDYLCSAISTRPGSSDRGLPRTCRSRSKPRRRTPWWISRPKCSTSRISCTPCSGWWPTGKASSGNSESGTSSTACPAYRRGQRVLGQLLLVVFVLLESIINGMFFAEGSEAGIIGGVMQALVLSVLNVGVAALFAVYGLPLLFHRWRAVKFFGGLLTVLFSAWLVGLNLAIGHFRDLFIANAGRWTWPSC